MVDPTKMTKYDLSHAELEEYILFCLCVFNKKALVIAEKLDRLLKHVAKPSQSPFESLRGLSLEEVRDLLVLFKISPYGVKSTGVYQLANSGFDLKTCSAAELASIKGIKYKTANFFILHTRRNVRIACLDTHVLKWLKHLGYKGVPKSSPQSLKTYDKWEAVFLGICDERQRDPAVLDLEVWNNMRLGYAQK